VNNGGTGFFSRSATGIVIENNAVACVGGATGCTSAKVARSATGYNPSDLQFLNNPTFQNMYLLPQVLVDGGASATVCNSGVAGGSGAITLKSGC
jgi:hypothetical protein